MKGKSARRRGRQIALHAVLGPLALVWLLPLWMMVVFSTMPENGIFSPAYCSPLCFPTSSLRNSAESVSAINRSVPEHRRVLLS